MYVCMDDNGRMCSFIHLNLLLHRTVLNKYGFAAPAASLPPPADSQEKKIYLHLFFSPSVQRHRITATIPSSVPSYTYNNRDLHKRLAR